MNEFNDFLKILETYKLKQVSRSSSNNYFCDKTKQQIQRKETTAEHIYSTLKLANYFLDTYNEFKNLDKIKIYELIMYHDDIEIAVGDINISDRNARIEKEQNEINSLNQFSQKYPITLRNNLKKLDFEYRDNNSKEANFAHAMDKFDALIHELQYPNDWGSHTGFTEDNVRKWFGKSFEHSEIFKYYFENILKYCRERKYFE